MREQRNPELGDQDQATSRSWDIKRNKHEFTRQKRVDYHVKYDGSAADCVGADAASLDACSSSASAATSRAAASPAKASRSVVAESVVTESVEAPLAVTVPRVEQPQATEAEQNGFPKPDRTEEPVADLGHGPKAREQNPPGKNPEHSSGDSEEERAAREERASNLDKLWASYWANPDDDTRNQLVEAYQRLVAAVVNRFGNRIPRRVDRGDLLTAGNVGLMGAVSGFDPERGVRFEDYCERRIRGALLDELRSQDWLPRPWRHRIEQHKRTLEALRAESNREPRDEEVARAMGLSLDTYEQLFGVALPAAPTGTVTDSAGEEVTAGLEVVPDTRSAAPGEKLTRDEILELAAQRMSEQEYRIVYLKYWEGLSMREVGELTSLSESRVCKIHSRLLDRLRDRFRGEFSGS